MKCVLQEACPVPFVGDALTARVATVSLNPSHQEFKDARGLMRSGTSSRLPTRDSLHINDWNEATDDICSQIADACCTYFERNPYEWFDPLDSMLARIGRGNLYEGGACHVDFVPWATDPIWSGLSGADKRLLQVQGFPVLHRLLVSMSVEALLLNGKSVVEELQRAAGTHLQCEYVPDWDTKRGRGRRWRGTITGFGTTELGRPIRVLGWNWSLQRLRDEAEVKESILGWPADALS